MNDEELSPKEKYEKEKVEREKEKQKQASAESRKATYKKIKKNGLFAFVGLVVIFGIYFLISSGGPQGEDFSVAFSIQGRDHVEEGTVESFDYNSNPPTSGPHFATTAENRFYEEEVDEGHLIHNLEHGDIWISYKGSISQEVKDYLKDLAGGRVVVTPREENDKELALAAWGRLDAFDLGGMTLKEIEQRIKDFIARYQNGGPENISPGHNTFN